MSDYLTANLEFTFINVNENESPSPSAGTFSFFKPAQKLDPLDCISFSLKKSKVKIQASETRTLTIFIEVDTMKLLDPKRVDQAALERPMTKLLVARLKNSKVLFSYFLRLHLVESECYED